MGDQKQVITTLMVIKVDLACEKCHKKIKKVLCKIPQIQNQVYDKKINTVTITVLCCSPEKIKEKISYKGGETVKGIEIVKPNPPKPIPVQPKPDPPKPIPVQPKPDPPKPVLVQPAKPLPVPVQPPVPVPIYCSECYQGIGGGAYYHGYGRPIPPCFEAYGRPVYDSWGGGGGGYYVCSSCEHVYGNNPSSCTIM